MQENKLTQLLNQISDIDNFQKLEVVEKQMQQIRRKLNQNKINMLLKSIKEAVEAAGCENVYETLEELMPKIKSRYGRKNKNYTIKYQNPYDETQTWTGVGFKPKWLVDGIAENKFTLDQCKIKN